jgi:PBP1b-binding outer membrane lipoprotein LpoB
MKRLKFITFLLLCFVLITGCSKKGGVTTDNNVISKAGNENTASLETEKTYGKGKGGCPA